MVIGDRLLQRRSFQFPVLALRRSPADDGDGQGSAVTVRTVHR
jgi:hypothetical protein